MKLLMAIMQDEDAYKVTDELAEAGFWVTKMASTGGFLRSGQTTLISGVEDSRVDELIAIIEKKCSPRKQLTPANISQISAGESFSPYPVEVTVGGATIFLLNIEEFKKV